MGVDAGDRLGAFRGLPPCVAEFGDRADPRTSLQQTLWSLDVRSARTLRVSLLSDLVVVVRRELSRTQLMRRCCQAL